MRKIIVSVVAVVFVLTAVSLSYAGWDSCKGCHTDSGKPAPSKATMLKKFKTSEELVKAAKESKDPMMANFKNETILKAAAKDMGLKEAKAATKKEDAKKDVKADDKAKVDKKEPAKESAPKAEEPKKKKKAIEGC